MSTRFAYSLKGTKYFNMAVKNSSIEWLLLLLFICMIYNMQIPWFLIFVYKCYRPNFMQYLFWCLVYISSYCPAAKGMLHGDHALFCTKTLLLRKNSWKEPLLQQNKYCLIKKKNKYKNGGSLSCSPHFKTLSAKMERNWS